MLVLKNSHKKVHKNKQIKEHKHNLLVSWKISTKWVKSPSIGSIETEYRLVPKEFEVVRNSVTMEGCKIVTEEYNYSIELLSTVNPENCLKKK